MGCRVKAWADVRSSSTRLALSRIVPSDAVRAPTASGGAVQPEANTHNGSRAVFKMNHENAGTIVRVAHGPMNARA
jgi:hypothetical protein